MVGISRMVRPIVTAVLLLLACIQATSGQNNTETGNYIKVTKQGPNGPETRILPVGKNETVSVFTRNGEVVGESVLQSGEIDVIVQLQDDPLVLHRGAGERVLRAALARHTRSLELLKSEILASENGIRSAGQLTAAASSRIVGWEYKTLFSGLAARVHQETLQRIERLPEVRRVWRDQRVEAYLDQSVPLIGANRVWTDLGVTGLGVVVAVVDTGIDYTHPDLGGCLGPRCKVIGGYDFVNKDDDPMDDHGHGTHVAGIIAADGVLRGVAPDARLMAFKVLNNNGAGRTSDVIAGIEKAVDPDGNPATDDGADVINLSLGSSAGDPDDPLSQAVDNAVAGGVVVVVAAGNTGGYNAVGSPAGARNAITVGASDKADKIAAFSSRGPAPVTYQIKPEVTAPGVSINSTVPRGSCPYCSASGYASLSGTSMAAPHVAGAAALLLERFPGWTPQRIKEALEQKSVDLGDNVFAQGSGRIDVYASATAPVLGTPGNLSLGWDDPSLPTFHSSGTITLENLSDTNRTYNLLISGTFPAGLNPTVTPSSVTLAPGQIHDVLFVLSIDNSVVPNSAKEPYQYEGIIIARSGTDADRFPFMFIKCPALILSFDEEPWIAMVHNRRDFFKPIAYPGSSTTVLLPAGTYDVSVIFPGADTRVVREGIELAAKTQVNISKTEAVHLLKIVPIGADGNPVTLSAAAWTEQVFGWVSGGFDIRDATFSAGMPLTEFHLSSTGPSYRFESSILQNSEEGNPAYTFYAYARDGIDHSNTFQNRPEDLKKVVSRHSVDPGVKELTLIHYFGGLRSFVSGCGGWLRLNAPYEEVSYLMPRPYADFSIGLVEEEAWGDLDSECSSYSALWATPSKLMYVTPFLAAASSTALEGYLPFDSSNPVLSTTSESIHFGSGPYSWFGKFSNSSDAIRVGQAIGGCDTYLYLGQLGELRPHDGLPYELYQAGTVIKSGALSPVGNPCTQPAVWHFSSFSLPVSPGAYELKTFFTNFYAAGQRGLATTTASFNTLAADPNPPYLTQFQLLAGGEFADTVSGSRPEIRFQALDDHAVSSVSLSYYEGFGWRSVPLTTVSPGTYSGILPFSPRLSSRLKMKLTVSDASGNSLTYETSIPGAVLRPSTSFR